MNIKLHYLFSRKEKWGSKLIGWASNKHTPLDNTPSHVALLVNERWVFESTFEKNVNIIEYDKWKAQNIQTHRLLCSQKRTLEEIMNIMRSIKGKKYDWKGILYFTWRFMLFWLFKKDIPDENKLEQPDHYFCCEAVGKVTGMDYSMKTPAGIYIELKKELKDA